MLFWLALTLLRGACNLPVRVPRSYLGFAGREPIEPAGLCWPRLLPRYVPPHQATCAKWGEQKGGRRRRARMASNERYARHISHIQIALQGAILEVAPLGVVPTDMHGLRRL